MNIKFRRFFIGGLFLTCALSAFSQDTKWLTDYSEAVELATKQNKPILLHFDASDWKNTMYEAIKMEILDTSAFRKYAKENLILMEVDFPKGSKRQTDAVKEQNEKLRNTFKVDWGSFPFFVLIDKDGNELGKLLGWPFLRAEAGDWKTPRGFPNGFPNGGPAPFMAALNTFYKSDANNSGAKPSGTDDFDNLFKKPTATSTR